MKHTVSLNEQQEDLIHQVLKWGIYGTTVSEFMRRAIDEKLQQFTKQESVPRQQA